MPHLIGCSLSLANVHTSTGDPARRFREGLSLARAARCEAVQLDGAAPGMRGRDLDRSGRRDVAAMLKREGVGFTGIDLWIPEEHFADAARVDRAVEALSDACGLAGELARLTEAPSVCVAVTLPEEPSAVLIDAVVRPAMSAGVRIADYNRVEDGPSAVIGKGFDPASALMAGRDPAQDLAMLSVGLVDARLTDFSKLGRCPVGRGELDVAAYRAIMESVTALRRVVVDVRTMIDPARAAVAAVEEWGSAGAVGR